MRSYSALAFLAVAAHNFREGQQSFCATGCSPTHRTEKKNTNQVSGSHTQGTAASSTGRLRVIFMKTVIDHENCGTYEFVSAADSPRPRGFRQASKRARCLVRPLKKGSQAKTKFWHGVYRGVNLKVYQSRRVCSCSRVSVTRVNIYGSEGLGNWTSAE